MGGMVGISYGKTGWTTCGDADVVDWRTDHNHTPYRQRVWLYVGPTEGAGNVSVDGPLMVVTDDEDMLLMLDAALEQYHSDDDPDD